MENLLRDGDYVPNGFGGFTRLYGTQEVLARALFRLTCRRGSFPFLPELGSRLQELGREKPSAREAGKDLLRFGAARHGTGGGRRAPDTAAGRACAHGGLADSRG